MKTHYYYP